MRSNRFCSNSFSSFVQPSHVQSLYTIHSRKYTSFYNSFLLLLHMVQQNISITLPFRKIWFFSFSPYLINGNLSFFITKLHIYVDMSICIFVGQRDNRLNVKFLGYFIFMKNAVKMLCFRCFYINSIRSVNNFRLGYFEFYIFSMYFVIYIPKIVNTSSFSNTLFTQIVASTRAIFASVSNCDA